MKHDAVARKGTRVIFPAASLRHPQIWPELQALFRQRVAGPPAGKVQNVYRPLRTIRKQAAQTAKKQKPVYSIVPEKSDIHKRKNESAASLHEPWAEAPQNFLWKTGAYKTSIK